MLAEDAVLAYGTVAFVGQRAVVADAKLDAVPLRTADMGMEHAISLLEPRYRPLVEIGFAPRKCLRVCERLDFLEGKDVMKR
ncbi:hypothetical protein [Paraburkholderia hospita]|uniref:hypothetical protein n=1 Tax=Paraburkholderia hospita TaxID=169430 RepID=UPI003F4F87A1